MRDSNPQVHSCFDTTCDLPPESHEVATVTFISKTCKEEEKRFDQVIKDLLWKDDSVQNVTKITIEENIKIERKVRECLCVSERMGVRDWESACECVSVGYKQSIGQGSVK